MSKSTVQVTFDAEKLGAIKQYMGKKDAPLNAEMEDFMQKLYEKHVPLAVRDYIETRTVGEELRLPRPQRPRQPKESIATTPKAIAPPYSGDFTAAKEE